MSPLYLSVITLESSDPKSKREPACVPALLAEGRPPSRPFIRALGVYRSASPGCEGPAQAVWLCGRCARMSPQLTFRLPPSGLALCLPPSLQRCIGGAFNSANED